MAEEEIIETTIIEERAEFMVDRTTTNVIQNPTKKTAFFLKPSLNPNALADLPPKLPKIQSFSSSTKPNVLFLCHSTPLKGWKTWVEKLRVTHEPVWRKAGIFDAIKGSTYHIRKIDNLIYRLVERWCPETNTFVFPWGEATVTLEDVFILGGFSPLGVSVSSSSSSLGEDVQQVENKLIETCRKLRDKGNNLSQKRWKEHFMGCGNEIEYAGFLALWLARHVFPGRNLAAVPQSVYILAARISCGAKLGFGPVILASIYRDLSLLKMEIMGSVSGNCRGSSPLKLSSPLQIVQIWAWERFPSLGPVPRFICCGEVRLARWESRSRNLLDNINNIDMCLDSARENFRWRPYGMSIENWSLPSFYGNSGMWVVLDSDEEWKLFARCLMIGQLRGLDCVEGYNPHRVALQFGFDQDIPESVDISKISYTLNELEYRMNFNGLKLYLPPRLHIGDVTYRYFDWRSIRSNVDKEALVGCKRKMETEKIVKKVAKTCDKSNKLEAIVVGNVKENSMENLPPRDEVSRDLLQIDNDIGMACQFNMQCVLIPQEDSDMEEDDEDEVWTINRTMGECSKINISCSKLTEIELSKGIYQEEGGMELVEILPKRKQGCDAMNSVFSQATSKHQNFGNEIGQVMVRCPLITPAGDSVKCEDVAREKNKERNLIRHDVKMEMRSEYLEANFLHFGTPTECHGTLIKEACGNEPDEALCQDNPFAALCLDYESRISRIERKISALSVSLHNLFTG